MKYTLALISFTILSTILYANSDLAIYNIKVPERSTVISECGTEFDALEYQLYSQRIDRNR